MRPKLSKKPASKKIWLLIDSRIFGGIESHILELAKGLKLFGYRPLVIFTNHYDTHSILHQKLSNEHIECAYLDQLSSNGQKKRLFQQLSSAVMQHRPDVIHTHGYKAALVARVAKILSRTFPKLISTFHAGESPTGKVWLYDFVDRYTGFVSNSRFAVSKEIQRKLPCSSILLNNFVSLPRNIPNYQQIAFVGRLSHEKGADNFIQLAKLNPNTNFSIYGDGPDRAQLELNAPNNITFYGHQKNMDKVWSNIDLLVISSRYEGLPMAALEAMARGIVVLSFSVGRLPELIVDGSNGFLAKDVRALSDKLSLWATLPEAQKTQVRQKAIETISNNFSTESVIPKLVQYY
ncbi:glycosyltransferase family 4 protein [Vibrio rotiferianus]|uniref:glycosyltransferase family 4 protein n=1 Tax=Vibrio rotiferianus TaxID=190895 RepID=UPI001110C7B7|nr:glycosyltransferase family 4 protein [Vibrio rotiferianus]TMX71434.1 glycosyl transferase family 1 [Vibrio rotiferianus]